GFIGITQDTNGFVCAAVPQDGRPDQLVPLEKAKLRPDPWQALDDGRRVVTSNEESVTIEDKEGKTRAIPLHYEAATEIMSIHPGPDGRIYALTHAPLRMCQFDPQTMKWEVPGNPFARANGSMGAMVLWKGTMIMAAY